MIHTSFLYRIVEADKFQFSCCATFYYSSMGWKDRKQRDMEEGNQNEMKVYLSLVYEDDHLFNPERHSCA